MRHHAAVGSLPCRSDQFTRGQWQHLRHCVVAIYLSRRGALSALATYFIHRVVVPIHHTVVQSRLPSSYEE